MPTDYERVARAITYIAENATSQPSLDDVATHVGLSPQHFQRVFGSWAGVSPKRYLQHLTAQRAKTLLRESRPLVDASFELGLSGPARLHDLMLSTHAVTPGEYGTGGSGLTIVFGLHDTVFGRCLIATTDRGICALRFFDAVAEKDAVAELQAEWPRADIKRDDSGTLHWIEAIFDPTAPADRPLTLLLKGTNFQLQVWDALLRIPDGCVISYSDLAERLERPTASRAVANAVGANPIAYLIPCHRVLRSTGELGGYRWGIDRKRVILARELEGRP